VTIQHVVSQSIGWLRTALLVAILASAAMIMLKAYGVILPFRTGIGHIELAYMAGVYWLTRQA
jgi:hypothetical protein